MKDFIVMPENPPKLSENLEDYLETISSLSAGTGAARPSDIAAAMNVKRPSVTAALNSLREKGLVEYEKYRPVTLTQDGESVAKNVRRKHELLSNFFTEVLGVNASEADLAACRMEHALEDSIMKKLVKFLKGRRTGMCSGCPNRSPSCESSCPHAVALSDLSKGERAVVLSIGKKLGNLGTYAGMGLAIGSTVSILRVAPLGDPVIISVHGSEISMRKSQLKNIMVKRI